MQLESISVFDIFKIGIGPSSSHTMGPWKAALSFLEKCRERGAYNSLVAIDVELFGSLAKTGLGHGTDVAIIMGLLGEEPALCDSSSIPHKIQEIRSACSLILWGGKRIPFDPEKNLVFHKNESLPYHPNGLRFIAHTSDGSEFSETYFSIGGGFVVQENQVHSQKTMLPPMQIELAKDLLDYCQSKTLSISEVVYTNELTWRNQEQIEKQLDQICYEMIQCAYRGSQTPGILPGGLGVVRRAAGINQRLLGVISFANANNWIAAIRGKTWGFQDTLKWVSCFALSVNEENAAFGRVVTAPTNGAAGVIPAVLLYYLCFCNGDEKGARQFLMTAGEFGSLFKKGATISAALGGCQAEIGVSSAMAAAALTEVMGGSPEKCMMAAEIAMEHHLGMTCDPVGGLVQIPCIERNTMGAIKAITASNLALETDAADAKVSMDAVIKSMRATALDMNSKYKETAEGGLALQISVNVAEC